jgi:hypothetical protein
MNPHDIYKALDEIRKAIPKSSKMAVHLIEIAGTTGMFDAATRRGAVIAIKDAWKLKDQEPTRRFLPTDENVIAYVKGFAEKAVQSPLRVLVVIDLDKSRTDVWALPKGMCFIATAASGSPFTTEVLVLSHFRDDVLLRSKLGAVIVQLYYVVSPPIAALISRSACLRRFAMVLIVRPAAKLGQHFQR